MVKRVMVALLVLIITITALIGYQWFMYDLRAKDEVKTQKSAIDMDVSIIHKDGLLKIIQTVSNLEQPDFIIKLPANASKMECLLSTDKKCKISEEGSLHRIKVDQHSTLSFSYDLTIPSKVKSVWLEDWSVVFLTEEKQEILANYHVSLSEKEDKTITWVAAALSKAEVDKEHLAYFAWNKNETYAFPLYMTRSLVSKINDFEPKLSLYVSNVENYNSFGDWLDRLPEQSGLTVVQSDVEKTYFAPLLLVVSDKMEVENIEELILKSFLLSRKQPKSKEIAWVWDVMPSFILNRPVGNGKVNKISVELLDKLGQESKDSFVKWLLQSNSKTMKLELSDFDDALSKASHKTTDFFTQNGYETEQTVPLFYYDGRSVFQGNKIINYEWSPIERNDIIHFPLVEMLESLDFDVSVLAKDEQYLITKGENSWRLYLNEMHFVYNKEDYGLTDKPLERLGEEVYISENWVEELLRIEVIKRNEGIYLR